MSDFTKLSLTIDGAVARIWLDQPEARNAFDDVVIAELTRAFAEAGAASQVKAIVLGANGPAFCAGANLNWMRRMADYSRDENIADAGKLAAMLRTIAECPKPTIARVQGDVYAGGMGLVAACDMAVSVDSAWYCLSEVKIGLVPATISPYVLRAMGTRRRGAPHRLRARGGGGRCARCQGRRAAQGADRREPGRRARLQAAGGRRGGPRDRRRADREDGRGHRRHPRQRRGPRGRAGLPAEAQAVLARGRVVLTGSFIP